MSADNLTPVQRRFILHWGEMGTRWGINRSVAQIHALLFLSPAPLDAETIAERLGLARSNVSTSLRELLAWGLARTVHELGDRRDYFITETDPWALARTVVRARKQREIDPTIEHLRACLAAPEIDDEPAPVRRRLAAMLDFFERTGRWYEAVDRLPYERLMRFLERGDRLPKLLAGERREERP